MKDITIIIPLHICNDENNVLLARAIKSVPNGMNITISTIEGCEEPLKWVLDDSEHNVEILVNNENKNSDFCTLVNNAVMKNGTEWFSILEFDDEYTDIWFKNVEEYIKFNPEVSVFLPLEELIDFNTKKFIGYGNEAPWATSFSEEIGYIDNESLQQYFDFYLTGGIYNADDWRSQGSLKPSIKLTFWYEFLLRLTKNGKKVFVIPKLGLKHYVDREGSLYDEYRKTITEEESNWWYELAQKEQYYLEDRNKTFENRKGE